MPLQTWKKYLIVVSVLLAAYLVVPVGSWVKPAVFGALGLSSAAVIALAGRRRPAARAWYLFAAGVACNASGVVVDAVRDLLTTVEAFPTVADPLYLGLYPAMAVGLALLIRRRTAVRDWGALVDATTITAGLGLLAWVVAIHPAAAGSNDDLLALATAVAYPVGDVVLLSMMVRLILGSGIWCAANRLLIGAMATILASDVVWMVIIRLDLSPGAMQQKLLDVTVLGGYALVATAALHSSAAVFDEPAAPRPSRLSPLHLGVLTATSLIAPAILAVEVVRHQITDGIAIVIGSVALFVLVITRMAQLLGQVESQAGKLRELALTDSLTGLANRRAWSTAVAVAMSGARRDGGVLCVALLDLDHFKRFNDTYGHPAGDRLLVQAATAWQVQLRTEDTLARHGGEEFAILLPATDPDDARSTIDRVRAATPLGQTVSAGLATWDGTELPDELLARADQALYAAKNAGRDRTTAAQQVGGEPVIARQRGARGAERRHLSVVPAAADPELSAG